MRRNADWWNRDPRKTARATAIHWELASEGVTPTSDNYIREVDKRLKAAYPEHIPYEVDMTDDGNGERRSTPRRTNVVTEGSREESQARSASGPPRTVELTQSEVSIAKRLNIPLQRYAQEKAKRMQSEGGA